MNYPWSVFLEEWNKTILELVKELNWVFSEKEKDHLNRGWLGYEGAREEEIQRAEERLEMDLPPSFRHFLQESNGWLQIGFDAETAKIFGTAELEWFATHHTSEIELWEKGESDISLEVHKTYGPDQDPVCFRSEFLKSCLQISEEVDSAVYLLNPKVKDEDGEWEAWFLGYQLPGANRYPSFWKMMQEERKRVESSLREAIDYQQGLL